MRSNNDKAAQTAVDEDMLLQHISALNAKLTVAFEKKIEPLATQIIAYKEVVAPLSQDLKRNLAALTPLLQQVQSLESALANTAQSLDQDKQAIAAALTEFRTDMAQAIDGLRASEHNDSAQQEQFLTQLRADIESSIGSRLEALESVHDGRLAELNATMGALGPDLTEFKSRIEALESGIDTALAAKLEPLMPELTGIRGAIDASVLQNTATVENALATLTSPTSDPELAPQIDRVIDALHQRENEIRDAVSNSKNELQTDISTSYSVWSQALETLTHKIDALANADNSADQSKFDSIAAQIEALQGKLAAHDDTSSKDAVVEMSTELARMGSQLEAFMQADSQTTGTAISADIDRIIDALNQRENDIREAVTNSKTELQTDMSTAYNTWSQALETLTAKIDALASADNSEDHSRFDAIAAQIDELQGKLDAHMQAESQKAAAETAAGFDRIIDTVHLRENDVREALAATKFELQTDMSNAYEGWSQGLNALSEKVTAIASQIHELSEITASPTISEATETVYQPVTDNLPDIIRDRVDEMHSRLTNSDWALQALGKNMASLMNEVSGMRDDVLSASMARRTYNAVEDIRTLVEEMPRRAGSSVQTEELVARMEATIDSVRTAIAARPDDLAKTLEQAKQDILATLEGKSVDMSGPIEQSRQDILTQIGSSISAHASQILSRIDTKHEALVQGVNATLSAIESAALQQQAWSQPFDGERPAVIEGYDPDTIMDSLKEHDPVTYKVWKPVFEAGEQPYHDEPDHNCSTWSTPLTPRFRDYVSLFAKGSILDIGCGPHPMPAYLEGYPVERLTGLEPLEISGDAAFPIIKGVNEFLPWADNSFETVVNATAIDHVMDLERSLSETCRILKADGRFIIWFADVSGMENYAKMPPENRVPVDSYHLFHVSSDWFLPTINQWFDLVDLRRIRATENSDNVFAVFRPRTKTAPPPARIPQARGTKPKAKTASPLARKSQARSTKKKTTRKR